MRSPDKKYGKRFAMQLRVFWWFLSILFFGICLRRLISNVQDVFMQCDAIIYFMSRRVLNDADFFYSGSDGMLRGFSPFLQILLLVPRGHIRCFLFIYAGCFVPNFLPQTFAWSSSFHFVFFITTATFTMRSVPGLTHSSFPSESLSSHRLKKPSSTLNNFERRHSVRTIAEKREEKKTGNSWHSSKLACVGFHPLAKWLQCHDMYHEKISIRPNVSSDLEREGRPCFVKY